MGLSVWGAWFVDESVIISRVLSFFLSWSGWRCSVSRSGSGDVVLEVEMWYLRWWLLLLVYVM